MSRSQQNPDCHRRSLHHIPLKDELGSDINAVGQNRNIAISMGIPADKIRITAIMISTLLAALGQLVFIQDIGNLQHTRHMRTFGTFIAALLVGGASIKKANIGHAILGHYCSTQCSSSPRWQERTCSTTHS
ncbi:MAG: ABC transporter permease subunit [Clostridium sp.]